MNARTRKRKYRWLGGIRILVYMNTNKQEKKKVRWFSPTRILVLLWGGLMLAYHMIWIGMTGISAVAQHIIGVAIEYWISGIYENSMVRIDKFINTKTLKSKYRTVKRIIIKYFAFSTVFSVTYGVVYTLRMLVLYFIGWGLLNWQQAEVAIINGAIFGITIGPIIGIAIVYARNKGLKLKITKKNPESGTPRV